MYAKLIVFFLRKKFKLKKNQAFTFAGYGPHVYFFNNTNLMKLSYYDGSEIPAEVSLNCLLDNKCEIVKL